MQKMHQGQLRANGTPYEGHPSAVVGIYRPVYPFDHVGFGLCLIHDLLEDSPITLTELESLFGQEVAFMVDTLSKRHPSEFNNREDREEDYYTRLFSAACKNELQ